MQSKSKSFWDEAKKCRPRKSNLPNTVDVVQGKETIAGNLKPYITGYLMTEMIYISIVKCFEYFNW